MKPPISAADPRLHPFYIDPTCPNCGKRLVLSDLLEDPDTPADEIWYDEWVCPDEYEWEVGPSLEEGEGPWSFGGPIYLDQPRTPEQWALVEREKKRQAEQQRRRKKKQERRAKNKAHSLSRRNTSRLASRAAESTPLIEGIG